MKKLSKYVGFAALAIVAGGSASFAANSFEINSSAICDLISQLGGLFKTLQALAFVGAAFIIAGWAWGYIKGGKAVGVDDIKDKGLGMLTGFILLFGMGVLMTFFTSTFGQQSLGCDVGAAFGSW